jgi:predicted DNA-binding transcriptional regulator YafY
MSAQAIIRRYKRIIDTLETGQFPSMDFIMEYIERIGLKASKRTIERDFEAIRNEFDIEIEYNQSKRGYFINKEKSLPIDSFLRLLELVETAHVFQESLQKSKETLRSIDFENEGNVSGIGYLQDILQAIRNHQYIRISHESYQSGKTRKYRLKPYLIKEFQGRWYVVGEVSGLNEVRTFGIDRITSFELLTKTFVPKKDLNLKEKFRDVVGLTYSAIEIQKVILSAKPEQLPYLKSLPLHSSQRIINDKEGKTLVEYLLKPNYEFIQLIFKHIDTIRVVEPEWLVDEVKEKIEEMRGMYS